MKKKQWKSEQRGIQKCKKLSDKDKMISDEERYRRYFYNKCLVPPFIIRI